MPASNQVIFSYTIENPSIGRLTVYSVSGVKVKELQVIAENSGENYIELNVQDFHNGLYFGELNINGIASTIKLLVSH
ncbi:MAG: T9SS type A sorting domain-containing protein [Bacteroidales bacterium]|nr:T9SS type A sorting domain-containing protein [Bacteroidales bacterium]